jgi:hypothetical protein
MKAIHSKLTTLHLMGHKYSLLYLSKKPLMQRPSLPNSRAHLNQAYINTEITKIQKQFDDDQKAKALDLSDTEPQRKRSVSLYIKRPHKLPQLPLIHLHSISPGRSPPDNSGLSFTQILPSNSKPNQVCIKRQIKLSTLTKKQRKEELDDKERAFMECIARVEKNMHREDRQRLLNGSKLLETKRMKIIKKIYEKKKLRKLEYGRDLTSKLDSINYTRESLEKLADNNSMRYFDSYKKFMNEYHQTIVMGLLAPSSKLKFRIQAQTQNVIPNHTKSKSLF